jgi:hypothetical protein
VDEEADSLCELCRNYDPSLPTGCRENPKKSEGISGDFIALSIIGRHDRMKWFPGTFRSVGELLATGGKNC